MGDGVAEADQLGVRLGDDLVDVTEAIVAGHEYVMAGPLTYPVETEPLDVNQPEEQP